MNLIATTKLKPIRDTQIFKKGIQANEYHQITEKIIKEEGMENYE